MACQGRYLEVWKPGFPPGLGGDTWHRECITCFLLLYFNSLGLMSEQGPKQGCSGVVRVNDGRTGHNDIRHLCVLPVGHRPWLEGLETTRDSLQQETM